MAAVLFLLFPGNGLLIVGIGILKLPEGDLLGDGDHIHGDHQMEGHVGQLPDEPVRDGIGEHLAEQGGGVFIIKFQVAAGLPDAQAADLIAPVPLCLLHPFPVKVKFLFPTKSVQAVQGLKPCRAV